MTIIKIEAVGGKHDIQYQSHRTECWEGGYIEVPRELEIAVNASCGYCDLTTTDGVLTAITPTERPVVPVPVPKPDPLTETQLAMAELAQVVEDNNTANQLAIAELAGIVLGG